MTPGACARIRLGAIRHNFQHIRNIATGCRTLAVIKGNAYGHGMLSAARALSEADAFGVARLSEAFVLRRSGISKPLVLLGGVLTEEELDFASKVNTALVVHSEHQVALLENCRDFVFSVWLKIDTGMNRLGFDAADAADVIGRLNNCAAVNDLKMMTHFANADDPGDATSARQLQKFRRAIKGFSGDISVANSAGLFGDPKILDVFAEARKAGRLWIRPGIALYGISPIRNRTAAALGLEAAMQFESRLVAVKPVGTGDRVGYGGTWQSGRDSVLGIVAAGYADGYTRFIPGGTPVVINGRRVPVAGVISMDLTAVDLGPGATDRVGDKVILWGDELPVETVAEFAGTVPYQLVTGVMHREQARFE